MGRTRGRSAHSKANVLSARFTDLETEQVDIYVGSIGLDRSKWLRALVLRETGIDGGE